MRNPTAAFRRTNLLLNLDLTTAMSTDPPPAVAPLLSSSRYSMRTSGNKKWPPCWARPSSARFARFDQILAGPASPCEGVRDEDF